MLTLATTFTTSYFNKPENWAIFCWFFTMKINLFLEKLAGMFGIWLCYVFLPLK